MRGTPTHRGTNGVGALTQSRDTAAQAEQVQIELLRRAGTAKRFALCRALTKMVMQLSRRAIARAHPGSSALEVDMMFLELHHGAEIAGRVRRYLQSRPS